MAAQPLLSYVAQLEHAQATLQQDISQDAEWRSVESSAKAIADALRTRQVDDKTALGASSLPNNIHALLGLATSPSNQGRPPSSLAAAYELLRAGANLCSDHDSNRQLILNAGVITLVVGILDAYWAHVSSSGPNSVSLDDLRLVKTAVGFLLNASVGFEPVRAVLVQGKAPLTILCLSSALYVPGTWASSQTASVEEWKWRSGLASWSWKAIENLKTPDDDDDEHKPAVQSAQPKPLIFDANAIAPLMSILESFIPPFTSDPSSSIATKEDRQAFVAADLDVLQEVAMLLESLSLDSEEIRLALASTQVSASVGSFPPLARMLDFVERAAPPAYWASCTDSAKDKERWEKMLAVCKGAVIKAIVIVAGEDKNLEVLWDSKSEGYPGGWFVERMVRWIKNEKSEPSEGRDDLIICATLSLANLARKASHSTTLLAPPVSLAPSILPLIAPTADMKVKHGAVGLLKHVAQAQPNKAILGEAGFIDAFALSGIWSREGDMAEVVQMSAIGAVKHLSYGIALNALRLVNSPAARPEVDSALDQILDLVKRSDSVALQSEGTRVLVNIIKGIFALKPTGTASTGGDPSAITEEQQREAITKIATLDSSEPLAEMLGRSSRYPILLHEAVIALNLLASNSEGLPCVLEALLTTLPYHITETGMAVATSTGNKETSNTGSHSPSSPLDMLVVILRNPGNTFQPELAANTCTLLSALSKGAAEDFSKVQATVRPALEALSTATDSQPMLLVAAAKKTLDSWGSSAA